MTVLLKVEDLHIFYGSIEALKGISLEVSEGEIVAVLGANGAGKSTLLRAISGLLPIRNGNIQLRGEKLNKVQAYEIVIKGISHAPEGRKVFITLTVEENLNLGAYTHRKDAKVITDAKERVFNLFPILKARRNQLAGTLSGGEQQMLSIGRALMSTPRILLLDEPSLGLAPFLVRQIFQIIREINDQGISILLVEQNARKALSIAHRGYVLETGNISISGLALDLKSNQKVQEAYLGGAAFKKKNRV
jgi:branched-chain amino acid transport system ATP-binding protein